MTPTTLNFALAADSNYFIPLETCIHSIIVGHQEKLQSITFYVLDAGLTSAQKKTIEERTTRHPSSNGFGANVKWLTFDETPFKTTSLPTLNGSYSTYARLTLAQLIPDLDQIIWVDADMLSGVDFTKLPQLETTSNVVAGALDPKIKCLIDENPDFYKLVDHEMNPSSSYINAGMLMIRLDTWRDENILEKMFQMAKGIEDKVKYYDQTLINHYLSNRIKVLDESYNLMVTQIPTQKFITMGQSLLHFAGSDKPWKTYDIKTWKRPRRSLNTLIATHRYLKFRLTELQLHQRELTESLRTNLQRVRKQYADGNLLKRMTCLFKISTYVIKKSPNKADYWKDILSHYTQNRDQWVSLIDEMLEDITQWPKDDLTATSASPKP